MRSQTIIHRITLIQPRKTWTTSILERKLTRRRCSVTTVKDLGIMLEAIEERMKHD